MWAYDLLDHLKIELETIIAMAIMTYMSKQICMSYIEWINKWSMIHKYVLLRLF